MVSTKYLIDFFLSVTTSCGVFDQDDEKWILLGLKQIVVQVHTIYCLFKKNMLALLEQTKSNCRFC